LAASIYYGIPKVLDTERERYANKRILIVGSGHSAFTVVIDLVKLSRTAPDTRITWAVRRALGQELYGVGSTDALPARTSLGKRVRQIVARGDLTLVGDFKVAELTQTTSGIVVTSQDGCALPAVDEIVAVTGFRPDLCIVSELRLALDPGVESPPALAPLIDPTYYSCDTVRLHGAGELKHPETDFYIVGMKSYGRAPTFLMSTGYEQVRSVVAAIRDDGKPADLLQQQHA
jgi:hypothetical protein